MTIADIRRMPLGHVVDFVIAYNERQKLDDDDQDGGEHWATQEEIDAYF